MNKVKEEGHYTIKRINKLPKKGNANFLYAIKGDTIDKLYRAIPKGGYETISIGSVADGKTYLESGTDVNVTGTGTLSDPYVINSTAGGAEYRLVDNRPVSEDFSLTEDGSTVSTVSLNASSVLSNPVENEYIDIASMLSDQVNQTETFFQYVSGTEEYYEKLIPNTSNIADYRLLSDTEVQVITDSNGYRVFRISDIQDDSTPLTSIAGGKVGFEYNNSTGKVTSVIFNKQYSSAITRFYDLRSTLNYKLKFYNRTKKEYQTATITGWTDLGNYYKVAVNNTITASELSINNRIENFFEIEESGGALQSVVPGQNIAVDDADPNNPIIRSTMKLDPIASTSISALNRQPMVSFVDDDMRLDVYAVLKPELDAQGIKIGFGVTTDRYVTATATTITIAQSIQLREEGHELLAHGVTHLNWDTLTEADCEIEGEASSRFLKEILGEHRGGMVFPYNSGTTEIAQRITKRYFNYAFGGEHDFNLGQTIPSHQVKRIGYGLFVGPTPTPVNGVAAANTLEYYKACVDYAVSTKSWITFNLHCYEAEFIVSVFNDLVDYIQGLNVPIVLPSVGIATFGNTLSIGTDVDNNIAVTKDGFFVEGENILEIVQPTFRITIPNSVGATFRPFFTLTYAETLEWVLTETNGDILERRYTDSGIITDFDCSSAGNKYLYLRGSKGLTTLTYIRSNSSAILSWDNFASVPNLDHFYDITPNSNITTLDLRDNKKLTDLTIGYSPVTMVLPPETTVISGILNYITIGNYPKTTVIKNAGKPYGLDTSPLALLTSLSINCVNMTTAKPLDITNNPLLSYISIGAYPVTSFDLSGSPAMTEIHANLSLVTTWDLSALPNLLKFYADNGAYATIDFTANVLLQLAWIRSGVKTTITLPTTTTMTEMRCDIDSNLTTINNLSNCTGMRVLHVNGSAFTQGTIDQILIDLDNNGASSGDLDISGQVGAVVRTKTFADTGTTDGTTTSKLVDSTQNFLTTVTIGDAVHNTTDNTWAFVTAIDSDTVLSIDADIMISGEVYEIEDSPAGKAYAGLKLRSWAIDAA